MSLRWSLLFACSCVGTADMVVVPQATPPTPPGVSTDAGAGDAGSEPPDAGTQPVDAGTPPVIDDAGFDAGPPAACAALGTRITTATIDVGPANVDVGSSYGWSNNRPVHLVGLTDGTAKVAWSGSGRVHVTSVSASLQRLGPDVTLVGESVRGFVAHDDGTAALLVVRGTGMFLVKLRADGTALFETAIVNDPPSETEGARWVDSWGHEGRLLFTGQVYVAYFGHTKHFGSVGKHQGDLLISLSATTGLPMGGPAGWDWGCSHSLDVRLAWDGASVAPVCLSDCYRTKAVLLSDSEVLQDEPSGNCGGSSLGELGGLAALGGGFGVTFSTKEGRTSRDVGFIAIDAQQRKSAVVWLTSGAGDESAPHLARYGPAQLLASWREGSDAKLAVLSAAGTVIEGPLTAPVGVADRAPALACGDRRRPRCALGSLRGAAEVIAPALIGIALNCSAILLVTVGSPLHR